MRLPFSFVQKSLATCGHCKSTCHIEQKVWFFVSLNLPHWLFVLVSLERNEPVSVPVTLIGHRTPLAMYIYYIKAYQEMNIPYFTAQASVRRTEVYVDSIANFDTHVSIIPKMLGNCHTFVSRVCCRPGCGYDPEVGKCICPNSWIERRDIHTIWQCH